MKKIIIHKNQTAFYTEVKNRKKLEIVLAQFTSLRHFKLTYDENRFIIKYKIPELIKHQIIKAFEKPISVKKEKKIVRGFTECLITGNQFKWL